jgi:hypothetical protein
MQNRIINLINTEYSLIKPLQAALSFAKGTDNEELYAWALKELNGYQDNSEVPSYRHTKSTIQGVIKKDGHFQSVNSLPLSYFGEIENKLTEKIFLNDVAALEYLFHAAYDHVLIKTFPQEYCLNLTQKAYLNGYDLEVKSCREFVELKDIAVILNAIKTELINFIQPMGNTHSNVMVA